MFGLNLQQASRVSGNPTARFHQLVSEPVDLAIHAKVQIQEVFKHFHHYRSSGYVRSGTRSDPFRSVQSCSEPFKTKHNLSNTIRSATNRSDCVVSTKNCIPEILEKLNLLATQLEQSYFGVENSASKPNPDYTSCHSSKGKDQFPIDEEDEVYCSRTYPDSSYLHFNTSCPSTTSSNLDINDVKLEVKGKKIRSNGQVFEEMSNRVQPRSVYEMIWDLRFLEDEGSFDDYLYQFIEIVFPIDRFITPRNEDYINELLLNSFVDGLNDEFRLYVLKFKPKTLFNAMNLAIFYEDKIKHVYAVDQQEVKKMVLLKNFGKEAPSGKARIYVPVDYEIETNFNSILRIRATSKRRTSSLLDQGKHDSNHGVYELETGALFTPSSHVSPFSSSTTLTSTKSSPFLPSSLAQPKPPWSLSISTSSLFQSTSSSQLFGTYSSISRSTLGANSTKTPLLASTTRASSSGIASAISLTTSQVPKLPSVIAGKTVLGKKGYSYYTMSGNKKISLKLLVDKKHCRVVLAESDKDFVDNLLSFLTMPMGTICRLLGKDSSIGCVANLYESIQIIAAEHLQTKSCNTMLLRPFNAEDEHCETLVINIDDTKLRRFFTCVESGCLSKATCYYSSIPNVKCCYGKQMSCGQFWKKKVAKEPVDGVFIKGWLKFIRTDDLHIMLAATTVLLSILSKLAENDESVLEEKILYLSYAEILYLLWRTLTSKIPLTNLCFNSSATNYMPKSSHMNGTFQLIPKSEFNGGSNCKEIKVKLLMTRSDNMVIHMEGNEGMVNIVFSFLASPLGSLIKLLDKNSSTGCVDNLYSSVENLCMQENDCIKSEQGKMMLLHPTLTPCFGCENHILLINENSSSEKCVHGCYLCKRSSGSECTATWFSYGIGIATLKGLNPKFPNNGIEPGGGYARERGKFTLTDNLRISLISPISTFSIITLKVLDYQEDYSVFDEMLGNMLCAWKVLQISLLFTPGPLKIISLFLQESCKMILPPVKPPPEPPPFSFWLQPRDEVEFMEGRFDTLLFNELNHGELPNLVLKQESSVKNQDRDNREHQSMLRAKNKQVGGRAIAHEGVFSSSPCKCIGGTSQSSLSRGPIHPPPITF